MGSIDIILYTAAILLLMMLLIRTIMDDKYGK